MADYVTVVEVDDSTSQDPQLLLRKTPPQTPTDEDSSFITVLSINNNNSNGNNSSSHSSADYNHKEIETVVVYRLPGERLGFGLKFQGGTRSTEKVQKLFIQSCAKDSPASKVITSWGHLREGDEIVKIDEMYVREMTRIECVKGLKDNVAIKLEVRNGRGLKPDEAEDEYEQHVSKHLSTFKGSLSQTAQMKGAPPPPPPVPPRKLVKKSQMEITSQAETNADTKNSKVTEVDGLGAQEKSFTPPPDAEFYMNLFAENGSTHTNGNHLLRPYNGESESDDTASTISTVIDRYSMTSNYSSESDLSGFNSLNQNHQVAINKPELAKVLKPFTLLEQEFQLNSSNGETLTNVLDSSLDVDMQAITLIPGNNYENIEFKTLKVNVYENMELKPKENDSKGEENQEEEEVVKTPTEEEVKQVTPTPKPRQVTAHIEPKKRSIIPMPRKLTPVGKQAIEVKPPKVPEASNSVTTPTTPTTPTNVNNPINTTPSNVKTLNKDQPIKTITTSTAPTTPTNLNNHTAALATTPTTPSNLKTTAKESSALVSTNPTKEFTTKIPKAIGSSPFTSPSSMERSKTESEIKLKPLAGKMEKLKLRTSEFLEQESHKLNRIATPGSPLKSRIPVHLHNKRSVDFDCMPMTKSSKSPTNIPRRLTKQKSETDLNLNYLINTPSKESSPINQAKLPLQRTASAEAKFKSPERCLIPVLQQPVTPSNLNSSNESFSSNNSSTKNRGPKPKPPERVQSLPKTNIPKLTVNNVTTVAVSTATTPSSPPAANMPSMQTFKQMSPKPQEKPAAGGHIPSPVNNREVLFKIQTYESKAPSKEPIINVFHDQDQQMPSLFELQRRSTPPTERRSESSSNSSSKESSPLNKIRNLFNETQTHELEDLERTSPPPLVVGKCMKIEDTTAPLYYSSSSSSSDDEDSGENSHSFSHDEDKDYICEDGEKLGPPELINGPGPSEAYFNLYWHSNMLPTIGEVEEECSSLEPQSLTNNG